jgi:Dolichyl-phosphate-mannose-protein mannosyltransferase
LTVRIHENKRVLPALALALALALVLALGAGLRVWGLDYGLPHPTARPDEERVVGRAQTIFASGDWHPGSFYYPSLPYYLDTLALHLYYQVHRATGRYRRPFDFLYDIAVTRPGLHYRICRWAAAGAGVGTVAAAFALGLAACGRRGAALLGALGLAVCHLHVRDSHFATVDVWTTFFVTLSLALAVRAARLRRVSQFVLAGLFAGLAISSKYNSGLVVLAIVAAALVGREGRIRERLRPLLPAALATLSAFALTSPYVLLRFGRFVADMAFLENFLYRSSRGELALWDHLRTTLPQGLGWPLAALVVAGVGRALWRRRPSDVVLLSFALPFAALVASVRVTFPRYLLPLLPVLLVLASDVACEILERVPRGGARVLATSGVSLLVLGPTLSSSIAFDRILAREDTRIQAASFVERQFQPQTLLAVCRGYGAPSINQDRRRPPAFRVEEIDCQDGAPAASDARFLVTHEHRQLRSFSTVAPDLASWLQAHAVVLQTFDPYRPGSRVEPVFFGSDAFYVPFSGFDAVERGGPVIRIWKITGR